MNNLYNSNRFSPAETLQNRYGLRVAARLSAGAQDLPHDISERLRASRMQALARRKVAEPVAQLSEAPAVLQSGNALLLGFRDDALGFWGRVSSAALVLALAGGLVAVNLMKDEDRATELAEVDAALLTDDLPPAAYTDPGFLQFLKTSGAGTERR